MMLGSLITGVASGETVLAARRIKRALRAYLLAGLAALSGAIFLLVAVFIWASERFGAFEAALFLGAALLVLAGLIVVVHRTLAGVQAKKATNRRKTDLTAIGVASAIAILPSLLRSKGSLGVLVMPVLALGAYALLRESKRGDTPPHND